jgi:mRNA interferase MazF
MRHFITSNLRLGEAPGNFLLPSKSAGLSKDSVVNVSQIITVDRSFLTEKIGTLSQKQLEKLEKGLKLVLSLE